jgi:hypothetical protein
MYRSSVFAAISFWIITIVVALLPLFFLPGSWGGIATAKSVFLYSGVFAATLCWLFAQFIAGSISVPRHRIVGVLGGWVLAVLASALASANTRVSLWGRGFAIDSFITVLVLALLAFLVASYACDHKRLVTLFLAAFIGSTVTVLLQVVLYLVHTPALSQVAGTGSLVGTWVDFAYLTTLTLITALLLYEVLAPKGLFRVLALVSMSLSTVVLVFLNFKTAWLVTLIAALLVFVYKSSVERSIESRSSRFPVASFSVLMIGVFFFITAASIGVRISGAINLTINDLRPSLPTTLSVVGQSIAHDPVFGAGPGRFAQVWDRYRPVGINQTAFWNTSFDAGSGLLPTIVATQGMVPTLLLFVLIVYSIIYGFGLFGNAFPDRFSRFIATAALIMVISMAVLLGVATPGIVLVAFGFLYIGMLVGVSQLIGTTSLATWHYLKDPRKSFLTIFGIVIAIILCVVAIYKSTQRFDSIRNFNKAFSAKDTTTADQYLVRAIAQSPNDLYFRARSALYTQQFASLANQEAPDKKDLQNTFSAIEQSVRSAVSWDPTNAVNWGTLAQSYQLVAPGGNTDALAGWRDAAAKAHMLAPNHPLYVILQAQQAMTAKDYKSALDLYTSARTLAPGNPDTWIGMVDALTALDRRNEALKLLDQFAQVFPTIKGVEAKRESIQPLSPTPTPATSKR